VSTAPRDASVNVHKEDMITLEKSMLTLETARIRVSAWAWARFKARSGAIGSARARARARTRIGVRDVFRDEFRASG